MKFITSINPNNIERSRLCVTNWLLYISEVVAVQSANEIDRLKPHFPEVTFVPTDDLDEKFDTKCPKVRALVDQCPGIIINSDIEILTDRDTLLRKIVYEDESILKCGVRWDYASTVTNCKEMNPYGIDVFNITNTLKNTLTASEYTIGQPGWDYYFVLEAHMNNIRVMTQTSPMFYHKIHEVNWNRWKLTLAQSMLEKRYDMRQEDVTRKVQSITGRCGRRRKK